MLLPLFPQALLRGTSKDASELCRAAARDALAAIPLAAETLLPLLDITDGGGKAPGPTPAKKRGPAKQAAGGATGRIDGEPQFTYKLPVILS